MFAYNTPWQYHFLWDDNNCPELFTPVGQHVPEFVLGSDQVESLETMAHLRSKHDFEFNDTICMTATYFQKDFHLF